ncbi:hypothetical protein [Protofrankia symbiont of Coriaria ruscifolia]|uniref:hypothetical protein n=1 Tax=Protofrankia symbiont of Coriaria ruscifolia TaxID=1306542 RepID=UPI0010412377|nr:hypothetical protein [Protofrankia symbiont of Coriaria ruscifolia]
MTTIPDLSDYAVSTPEDMEWYLSDHPWAAAERARRRAAICARELERAATVTGWSERTRRADATGELVDRPAGWRDSLVGLAESMESVAADNQRHVRAETALSDAAWVARERRRLETHRQAAGDRDYTYPAHLIGPGAAAYPPPDLQGDHRRAGHDPARLRARHDSVGEMFGQMRRAWDAGDAVIDALEGLRPATPTDDGATP